MSYRYGYPYYPDHYNNERIELHRQYLLKQQQYEENLLEIQKRSKQLRDFYGQLQASALEAGEQLSVLEIVLKDQELATQADLAISQLKCKPNHCPLSQEAANHAGFLKYLQEQGKLESEKALYDADAEPFEQADTLCSETLSKAGSAEDYSGLENVQKGERTGFDNPLRGVIPMPGLRIASDDLLRQRPVDDSWQEL